MANVLNEFNNNKFLAKAYKKGCLSLTKTAFFSSDKIRLYLR